MGTHLNSNNNQVLSNKFLSHIRGAKGLYFLMHYGVVRQDKELRIVLSNSAKPRACSTFSERLFRQRYSLITLILNMLIKFCIHQVYLGIDSGKQILIQEGDHDLLRFLWFKNLRNEQPEAIQYRFCHLIFGLKSRPADFNAVIYKHLLCYKECGTQIVQLLSESFM